MADVGRLVFSAHRNDSLEAARRTFELHESQSLVMCFHQRRSEVAKACYRGFHLSRRAPPRRAPIFSLVQTSLYERFGPAPTLLGVLRTLSSWQTAPLVSHNDIGVDLIVKWHKDRLNQEYAVFQQRPLWSDGGLDGQRIIKAAIYLQDHTTDNQSLVAVPGSWREPSLCLSPSTVTLHPPLGSAVIFEQRNTHRGAHSHVRSGNVLSGSASWSRLIWPRRKRVDR